MLLEGVTDVKGVELFFNNPSRSSLLFFDWSRTHNYEFLILNYDSEASRSTFSILRILGFKGLQIRPNVNNSRTGGTSRRAQFSSISNHSGVIWGQRYAEKSGWPKNGSGKFRKFPRGPIPR
jgi:hypothetical protein